MSAVVLAATVYSCHAPTPEKIAPFTIICAPAATARSPDLDLGQPNPFRWPEFGISCQASQPKFDKDKFNLDPGTVTKRIADIQNIGLQYPKASRIVSRVTNQSPLKAPRLIEAI